MMFHLDESKVMYVRKNFLSSLEVTSYHRY